MNSTLFNSRPINERWIFIAIKNETGTVVWCQRTIGFSPLLNMLSFASHNLWTTIILLIYFVYNSNYTRITLLILEYVSRRSDSAVSTLFWIRSRRIFMRHETPLICSFHFQRWRDNCAKSFIRREQCAERKNIVQNEVNSVGNVYNVPLTFIWQLTQIIIILLR